LNARAPREYGGALCSPIPLFRPKKLPEFEHWGQVLGTGLRLIETRSYRVEATKKAICWPFVKPSDGLEPSTPSL
jgi:hypothetical protein